MAASTSPRLSAWSNFHLQNNTDAILVLGTTGESATMTDEEDNAVVAAVVKRVAGRIPVIAGSGSNSTATMLDKSLSYQRSGADRLVSPSHRTTTNPTKRASIEHFKTVADAVDIPCILYNIPGRCGCGISKHNGSSATGCPSQRHGH